MKRRFDIRKYKRDLRTRYRKLRKEMPPAVKKEADEKIRERILAMPEYQSCTIFLCYVSTPEEINTHPLLERAIADGKRVGVPYCISGTREMEFYQIFSLEELKPRTFGVLEPVAKEENLIREFKNAFCILPGISFDRFGYRLGYGGGYYDRFLSRKYKGKTAGICYQAATRSKLIHGRYDVPCDFIVTEMAVRRRQKPPKKGGKHKPRRKNHSPGKNK